MASRQNTLRARSVKDASIHNDNTESGTPDGVARKPREPRKSPATRLHRPKTNDRKAKARKATPHAADADGASTTRSVTTTGRVAVEGTLSVDCTGATIVGTADTDMAGTRTGTEDVDPLGADRPVDGRAMLDAIGLGLTFGGLTMIEPPRAAG